MLTSAGCSVTGQKEDITFNMTHRGITKWASFLYLFSTKIENLFKEIKFYNLSL